MRFVRDFTLLLVSYVLGPSELELWNTMTGRRIITLSDCHTQAMPLSGSKLSANVAFVEEVTHPVIWNLDLLVNVDEVQSHLGSAQFIAASPDGN